MEIKGRGLTALALETPDYMRARNATDIASQVGENNSLSVTWGHFMGNLTDTSSKENEEEALYFNAVIVDLCL